MVNLSSGNRLISLKPRRAHEWEGARLVFVSAHATCRHIMHLCANNSKRCPHIGVLQPWGPATRKRCQTRHKARLETAAQQRNKLCWLPRTNNRLPSLLAPAGNTCQGSESSSAHEAATQTITMSVCRGRAQPEPPNTRTNNANASGTDR